MVPWILRFVGKVVEKKKKILVIKSFENRSLSFDKDFPNKQTKKEQSYKVQTAQKMFEGHLMRIDISLFQCTFNLHQKKNV